MKKATLFIGVFLLMFLVGCAALEKFAPAQFDADGNRIPGTHALTAQAKPFVDMTGPYGQAAVAIPLAIWNFVELYRSKKSEKGLKATVMALKQASQDPSTKAAFDQIKQYLANAHDAAGVTQLIKNLIAKV